MTVIPFNPGGRSGSAFRPQRGANAPAYPPAYPVATLGEAGAPVEGEDRNASRRGAAQQHRIEALERILLATLRENATNWARAERAERLLDRANQSRPVPADRISD